MSFLTTDTKGDLYRLRQHRQGALRYNVGVIDLRNPTRSEATNDPPGEQIQDENLAHPETTH